MVNNVPEDRPPQEEMKSRADEPSHSSQDSIVIGSYRYIRGSKFGSGTKDETHLFLLSELLSGETGYFGVYGYIAASFTLKIYVRKDIAMAVPIKGYTPYTVPISAVMDNSWDQKWVIKTYDGVEARFEYCCLEYLGKNSYKLRISKDGLNPYPNGTSILGYKKQGGGSILLGINYTERTVYNHPEHVFYDGHTGYDYEFSQGTPVYACMGGDVTHVNDPWNSIIVKHGDGWETHYLHMLMDSYLAQNGAKVSKRMRIGTVGGTGGVGPHLHSSPDSVTTVRVLYFIFL